MNDTLKIIINKIVILDHKIDSLSRHLLELKNNGNDVWSYLIPTFATIAIGLIAGFVALYQVKSNVVASSRIAWIENLRVNLSEFVVETTDAVIRLVDMVHLRRKNNNIDYPEFSADYNRYFECNSRQQKLGYKCKMYLNPNEPDHQDIYKIIDAIHTTLNEADINKIDIKEIRDLVDKIVPLSTKIFRDEWKKSKKTFKR